MTTTEKIKRPVMNGQLMAPGGSLGTSLPNQACCKMIAPPLNWATIMKPR